MTMHKGIDRSCGGPGVYSDVTAHPRPSEYKRKSQRNVTTISICNGNSGQVEAKYGRFTPLIPSHAPAAECHCSVRDSWICPGFWIIFLPLSPPKRAQRLESARRLLVPTSISAWLSCEATRSPASRWDRHVHFVPHCSGRPARRGRRGSLRPRRRRSRCYAGHGLRPGRDSARVPQGAGGWEKANHSHHRGLN